MGKKTLKVKINPDIYLKVLRKSLGKKHMSQLDAAINEEIFACREHFKRDSWDLSYTSIESTILSEVVPNYTFYILGRLQRELPECKVDFKKNKLGREEFMLVKKKGKKRGKKST